MTPLAVAAVLTSAALHATWNGLLKGSRDPAATAVLIGLGAALFSTALALLQGVAIPASATVPTLLSGAIEAVYFVTLAGALARLPLGTTYGLARGGGQLVTWPLSVLTMHERLTPRAAVGAVLVTAGLASTASGGGSPVGLAYAAGCAVAIGFYPITYKAALGAGAGEAALFAASIAISLPLQALMLGATAKERLRAAALETPHRTAVAAALCAASFLTFLVGLAHGDAGRASALRNTSVLFATAVAWRRGEPVGARTIVAMAAIVLGAALVLG